MQAQAGGLQLQVSSFAVISKLDRFHNIILRPKMPLIDKINSVPIVSLGRLVSLGKANESFIKDLTWSTVTYIEWVQCEGPVSLISVCLPTIFSLAKSIYTSGLRSFPKNEGNRLEAGYRDNGVNQKNQFIRMDTYPSNERSSYRGEAGE